MTTFKLVDHGSEEWKEAVELRENVLRKPLGSFFTQEELSLERGHYHVSGYRENALVATAVLVPEIDGFKMQRVAVQQELRNQGIGRELLFFCEEFAAQSKVNRIYCHARDTAVQFYRNNGYVELGAYFDEDGIPHLYMQKQLKYR